MARVRLLVINPNTSREMTESIRRTVVACASPDFEPVVEQPKRGPESLESFFDYAQAAVATLELIRGQPEFPAGVLLACFGDPGLYALKEVLPCPVLGIAEASFSLALLLGDRFSILVASDKAVPMMANLVRQYGLSDRLASVQALGLPVLDVHASGPSVLASLTQAGRAALGEGAEVLVLGCAGMTGLSENLQRELAVPVIDPVRAGYKLLEAVVAGGFSVSRTGLYGTPVPKRTLWD